MPGKDSFQVSIASTVEKIFEEIKDLSEKFTEMSTKQEEFERVLIVGNGEDSVVTKVRKTRERVHNVDQRLDNHLSLDANNNTWKSNLLSFAKWAIQIAIAVGIFKLAG